MKMLVHPWVTKDWTQEEKDSIEYGDIEILEEREKAIKVRANNTIKWIPKCAIITKQQIEMLEAKKTPYTDLIDLAKRHNIKVRSKSKAKTVAEMIFQNKEAKEELEKDFALNNYAHRQIGIY